MQETIVAISTPFGEGAIALLRMSGPEALAIAARAFHARSGQALATLAPRYQHFGDIRDGEGQKLDEVLLAWFKAPASYTGEEMVEIACHGGILVTRRILGLLLELGARSASGGEFTQRAFLNGKMDLTQAEAVMDLITAQTDLAMRAATEQLEGRLGGRVRELKEALLGQLAHVEAYIDFPEEDIDPETGEALCARLEAACEEVRSLLKTADHGRVLREGVRTVIYGEPNVGKSSLLNLLLGYERAIVSNTPGTTRDTLEEVVNLRGIPLRLVDTAGVRESRDAIEQEGIARTMRHLERADLVLHVVDASRERCLEPQQGHLLILNKADLGIHPTWEPWAEKAVVLSCLSGEGEERLGDAVFTRVMGEGEGQGLRGGDFSVAINARHKACLQAAERDLTQAIAALRDGLSPEFIAIELRAALDEIGEIVGRVDTEDLIGKIFSTFCLGK